MKILVVLSRVPWPLEKGDKLRAYHLMKELAKKHDVYLFCLADTKVHPMAEQKLREFCTEIFIYRLSIWGKLWRLLASVFRKSPFQVNYFYSINAQVAFDQFLEENLPQHIVCQLLRTTEFVRKYDMIPKSIDYMDALGAGMLKMAKAATWPLNKVMMTEYNRLMNYEKEIEPLFQQHYIISEQDKLQMPTASQLKIIPNGVGAKFFEAPSQKKSIDILFTGNMNYRPNVESARFLIKEVMPLVWQQIPELKVTLAGATPSPSVLVLKSNRVQVTGWVDDIAEVYQQARIFVAPMLINSGMQNKLLEAMASGIPCITTTLANNAVKAKNEEQVLIGDTAQEIANQIIRLNNDGNLANEIALNAKKFVKETYSWKSACNILEEAIIQSALD